MCGILGVASRTASVIPERLAVMRDTMVHRGPDDAGLWCAPDLGIGLAHRRLAIIDLSPAGHQPMRDTTGNCCVVLNGEIYNYRKLRVELEARGHHFRSASDTEVLLEAYRAWGTECLSRLNGMFAFGLYDRQRDHLFLARDRGGEKPLYYRHSGGTLTFASELKALLADPDCPRAVSLQALEHYLAFGYVPGALCMIEGIRKLPAAHAAVYDCRSAQLRVWPYWKLPDPAEASPSSEDLVDELDELLADSVRLRMIADVPIGVMLSGGMDSSLITAMAARVSPGRVRTFTIGFPGHGVHDESAHARLVAQHFGTEHVELAAEPVSVELLPELARQCDEPLADSSLVPTYIVSRLIRRQATVALGGDGGDELFGGYPYYSWLLGQVQLRRLLPEALGRMLGAVARRWIPSGVKGRNYVLALAADRRRSLAQFNVYFDTLARARLLSPVEGRDGLDGQPESFKLRLCQSGRSLVYQMTALDFQTYLVDDILVKVDRASMLASLEVRAPWLDPRIIEFAFRRVPDDLRVTRRERKVLPGRLARRLLPAEFDLTRKQGFSLPLDAWLKGRWGDFVNDVLRDMDPAIFDRRVVRRLLDNQRRGLANAPRLFALTMFELWRRHYRISGVAPGQRAAMTPGAIADSSRRG